jgi:hypothetical protein
MGTSNLAVNTELLEDGQTQEVLPVGVYLVDEPTPPDRVKLFEVNGRQYTAPRMVDKRLVFRYLRALHDDEGERALADMMYGVLGAGVIDALAEEELSDEQFDQVMRVVRKHVMGATEKTLGNSQSGRRR